MEAIDVLLLGFLIGNIAVSTPNITRLSGPLIVWHRTNIMTCFYFFLIAFRHSAISQRWLLDRVREMRIAVDTCYYIYIHLQSHLTIMLSTWKPCIFP